MRPILFILSVIILASCNMQHAIKNDPNVKVSLIPAITPAESVVVVRPLPEHEVLSDVITSTAAVSMQKSSMAPSSAPMRAKMEDRKMWRTVGAQPEIYLGRTPGSYNTEDYDAINENGFLSVTDHALSTFSIDVDAASYSNIRRYLDGSSLPPAGSVRIEEMINYFHYDYAKPLGADPFTVNTELAVCPWSKNHQLVSVGLQGMKIPTASLPASNLVFLVDVSGSMQDENKLPLVKSSLKLLADQLREQDRVSMVVYAGSAGVVLHPTAGSNKNAIKEAVNQLEAGGSTAGSEGIRLAYELARSQFRQGGNNRVILCTDGDFNVGVSSDAELEHLIEKERVSGIYLTVLGYGMGNYKDNKMQKLADKGNGNHAYIDGIEEARKVLVHEFGGTLFTIANDMKLQVEFNPARVQAYRLIGYENRMLAAEDFNNDKKDAGEMGSGHTVTALYEVIPAGVKNEFSRKTDPLKYQLQPSKKIDASRDELMTVKVRYKKPGEAQSRLLAHPVTALPVAMAEASSDLRFAAAVAEFGLLLSHSEFKQAASFQDVLQLSSGAVGNDEGGYRKQFLGLVRTASRLSVTGKPMRVYKDFLGER